MWASQSQGSRKTSNNSTKTKKSGDKTLSHQSMKPQGRGIPHGRACTVNADQGKMTHSRLATYPV